MMKQGNTPLMSRNEQIAYEKFIEDLKEKFPVFSREELKDFYTEFQRFDIDGSGDIDHYEIMQLFRKVGEKIPKKAAQAIIAQFDTEGDGSIDFEEFLAMMYGLKLGTLSASNGFLRAYILERSSHETLVDMCRTSSSNLTDLKIEMKVEQGKDNRLFDALQFNHALRSVHINSCSLDEHDARLIGDALMDNTTLQTLNLHANQLQDEGFEAIVRALRMPPDSQEAWAQCVDARAEMDDLRDEYKGVEKNYQAFLAQLKRENRIMRQEAGDSLIFNDPSARKMFDEIRKKKEGLLMELEVAGLREMDARQYYEGLKGNRTLTELDCGDCYLFEQSGFEMAKTLIWNTSLVTLNLGRNSIGEEGIIAMATALKSHVSLTSLNLEGNIFGAEAGKALADMLVTNTQLTNCNFADNSIADEGCREFTAMLNRNRTLLSLDLSGNLLTAGPARDLVGVIVKYRKEMVLTNLGLLRNVIAPSDQLLIQHDLGKDWKFKGEVEGISCKLRALPPAEEAMAALTDKQKAAMESAFHAFDEDGSGDIDARELYKAVELLQLDMKEEEVEDLVQAIDKDGSGSIDYEEFCTAMAVMFAMNAAEDDSDEEVEVGLSEDEQVRELMFASGVYDPCHVFPEAMKWDKETAQQLESYPALRMCYRLLCQVERNASLSDKHQKVVRRAMTFLGWDKKTLKRNMPYTAKQLRSALAQFESVAAEQMPAEPATDSGQPKPENELEKRLALVEMPQDDQAKLDQAILWLFRGTPLVIIKDDDD